MTLYGYARVSVREPEEGPGGPPRKFRPHQVQAMRRMRDGGASLRRIAVDFECSPSTVLRVLHREGVAP